MTHRKGNESAIGMGFDGQTRLANGIILLKDGEIEYYEVHPMRISGPDAPSGSWPQ
jgi:hypothetical protein